MPVQTCLVLVLLARTDRAYYQYDIHNHLPFINHQTLSSMIERMLRDGYIEWCDGEQPTHPNVNRRKYFQITDVGRRQAQVARERLIEFGHALDVLGVRHGNGAVVD